MGTRPQTLYGLADSPTGLAAWLLDHNDADGQPAAAEKGRHFGAWEQPELYAQELLAAFRSLR